MDNSSPPKKQRAPNFSNKEKGLLLDIITTFKCIIENKKTDSQTWKDKDEVWMQITHIFNSRSVENVSRSKESLRKYYENLKKNIRKQVVEDKREMIRTGGGTAVKDQDQSKELLLSIINEKTIYGLNNPYDEDSNTLLVREIPHTTITIPDVDTHLQDHSYEYNIDLVEDVEVVTHEQEEVPNI